MNTNINEFAHRYMSNEHILNLMRVSYSIEACCDFFKYEDTQKIDKQNAIISLFSCHMEKFHKFLCFGTYYKIVLDICNDVELFELQEFHNIDAIHELIDIYEQLDYSFNNSKTNYAKAEEVVKAINNYVTAKEILYELK